MDVFSVPMAEHRQAKLLLDELAAGEDLSQRERAETLLELQDLMLLHNQAAESVIYPALLECEATRALAAQARIQHEAIGMLIARLGSESDEDRWRETLEAVRMELERHVESEDSMIFAAARRQLDADTLRRIAAALRLDEPAR